MGRRGARASRWALLLILLLLVLRPCAPLAQEAAPPREPGNRPSAPAAERGQPTTTPPGLPEPLPTPPPSTVPSAPPPLLPTLPVVPEPRTTPPPPTVPSVAPPVFPTLPFGLPRATFRLLPSLRLAEEYTDNFNLTPRDRQDNFRTSLAPGLILFINSPFTFGVLAYTPEVVHDSSDDSVSLFHSFLGQVSWQATPHLSFAVSDVLTRTDEPSRADRLHLRSERRLFTSNIFSLNSEQLIGTITTREYYRLSTFLNDGGNDTTSHTIGAAIEVPFYRVNTASLGYEYLRSTTSGTPDITGHQITGALTRQIVDLTGGIAAGYAFRNGLSPDVGPGGSQTTEDFQIWNASLFGGYAPPRWWLRASLGVAGLRRESGEDIGPLPIATAELIYFFPRGTVQLAFDRGFSETFDTGDNQGVIKTQGVTASLSYSFIPALTGTVSGFYRENDFTGVGGGTRGERANVWGAAAGVQFRLSRQVTIDFEYRHTEEIATPRDNSYTENRGRITLVVGF